MTASDNHVLRALPDADREQLTEHLHPQDCAVGDVLIALGAPLERVFFPLSGRFSAGPPTASTTPLEVIVTGSEGVLGLADALGSQVSTAQVVCQSRGQVLGLPVDVLAEAMGRPAVREVVGRALQAKIAHLSQKVVCARTHEAAPRLATCLLQVGDQSGSDTFPVTHQVLAITLGVRRATVSVAAAALQETGAIKYRYGQLTVTDRSGLQAAACECYVVERALHQDAHEPAAHQ